jgi:hypothetical protein
MMPPFMPDGTSAIV